jgi:serine/threonine-protein kinase
MPEAERGAWLRALPVAQQPYVPILGALLARAEVETDTFLQHPIGLSLDDLEPFDLPPDAPGDQVGPYRLLKELGAGGMANVWLAERADGVLQRQVALKLPRAGWALGLAQRMARERDILGALEHPHIARLYDAGVTAAGRPWMALEWVSGVPIDQHCTQHVLGVPQRLRLILQVAEAVAHAHARLIVHRDLKPSNILVTPEGEVRLLDFGVAKLLEDDSARSPALTQLMGRAVTPDYASPEQVAGKPVGVATDVYSLGVVLYELLTGQRPYRLGRQSMAALEEAILAADVPLASTRVAADKALARALRGDIDNVLVKALHKDPARRYASVESFAADLQRHLDGEPIHARPPSRRYRIYKFMRRNRLGTASVAAVAASLVLGFAVALWQARQARHEAGRAEQVKEFMASVLKQATPREGGVVTAGDLLLAASQRIEKELAGNPRAAAELGVIVGQGFFSLGEARKGETALRAAIARAEKEFGRRHPITLQGKALLVEALEYNDLAAAETIIAEVVPDALAGLPGTAESAVFALRSQSWLLALRNRADDSYAASQQAIGIGETHLGPLHRETIRTLRVRSAIFGRLGDSARQLGTATEALARARASFGDQTPDATLNQVERAYGNALAANQRPGEAVPVLTQALKDQRLLDGADTSRVALSMYALAVALRASGRATEALAVTREAVALQARLNPADSQQIAEFGGILLDALTLARRVDEAQVLERRIAALPLPVIELPVTQRIEHDLGLAHVLALAGEHEAAARSAAAVADLAGEKHPRQRATAWLVAALNARLQRRPAEAQAFAQRVLAEPESSAVPLDVQARAHAEAGNAWIEQGDFGRAEEALRAARALFTRAQVEPGVGQTDVLIGLARVHLRAGRAGEAEALLLPLASAWESVNANSAWHGEALVWLARAQALSGKADDARMHRQQAQAMLRGSKLPALQRLLPG